jgi:WD40 repeat protein
VAKQELLVAIEQHSYGVGCVQFHPTCRHVLLSVGYCHDQRIHLWTLRPRTYSDGVSPFVAQLIASASVSQQIYSASWEPEGAWFVTAGVRHFKFWEVPGDTTARDRDATFVTLVSRPAVMLPQHHDSTFVDVKVVRGQLPVTPSSSAPKEGVLTLTITAGGVLAAFDESRLMDRWVTLQASSAFSLSVSENKAWVGCADGIVRCFHAESLAYGGSLPPMPTVGSHMASGMTVKGDGVRPACVAVAAFGSGARVATVYGDRSLIVWSVPSEEREGAIVDVVPGKARRARSFLHHSGPVWDVGVVSRPPTSQVSGSAHRNLPLPEGSIVSVSVDGTVRLWSVDPTVLPPKTKSAAAAAATDARSWCVPARHPFGYETLAVLPLGGGAVWGEDGVFKEWGTAAVSTAVGRAVISAPFDPERGWRGGDKSTDALRCVSIRAGSVPGEDGEEDVLIGVGNREGELTVLSTRSMRPVGRARVHEGEVMSASFAPATGVCIATAGRDRRIQLLDARATRDRGLPLHNVASLTHHSGAVTSVAFSYDDCKLVSTGADSLVAFSKLTVGGQSPVDLVAISTTASVEHPKKQSADEVSPGMALVRAAAASAHRATAKGAIASKVWRTASNSYGTVYTSAMDATNRHVLTGGGDKTLRVWALRSGSQIRSHKLSPSETASPGSEITKVVMDPSGLYAAVATLDKAVAIVDFYSGKVVARMAAHGEVPTGMAFTPDCKRLITVGGDGVVMVWRLSSSLTKAMRERIDEITQARNSTLSARAMRASHAMLSAQAPKPQDVQTNAGVAPEHTAAPTEPVEAAPPALPSGKVPPPPLPASRSPDKKLDLPQSDIPSWALHSHVASSGVAPIGRPLMFGIGDDEEDEEHEHISVSPSGISLGIEALAAAIHGDTGRPKTPPRPGAAHLSETSPSPKRKPPPVPPTSVNPTDLEDPTGAHVDREFMSSPPPADSKSCKPVDDQVLTGEEDAVSEDDRGGFVVTLGRTQAAAMLQGSTDESLGEGGGVPADEWSDVRESVVGSEFLALAWKETSEQQDKPLTASVFRSEAQLARERRRTGGELPPEKPSPNTVATEARRAVADMRAGLRDLGIALDATRRPDDHGTTRPPTDKPSPPRPAASPPGEAVERRSEALAFLNGPESSGTAAQPAVVEEEEEEVSSGTAAQPAVVEEEEEEVSSGAAAQPAVVEEEEEEVSSGTHGGAFTASRPLSIDQEDQHSTGGGTRPVRADEVVMATSSLENALGATRELAERLVASEDEEAAAKKRVVVTTLRRVRDSMDELLSVLGGEDEGSTSRLSVSGSVMDVGPLLERYSAMLVEAVREKSRQ